MKNEPFYYKGIYETHYNQFRYGYEHDYKYNLMKCDKNRVNPVLINWGVLNTPHWQWLEFQVFLSTSKKLKRNISKILVSILFKKVENIVYKYLELII